jgi:hypothetical protein
MCVKSPASFWLRCDTVQSMALWIVTAASNTQDVGRHWRQVLHLCALTLSASAVNLARILLAMLRHQQPTVNLLDILTAVEIVLVTVVTVLAFTMDKGPQLHHKPRELTGEAHAGKEDPAEANVANVSPLAWCSPASRLLFNWASPLLAVGAKREQLSADDIPSLTVEFRAAEVFAAARDALERDDTMRPRWFNPLLWRLAVLNRRAFAIQVRCAWSTACPRPHTTHSSRSPSS